MSREIRKNSPLGRLEVCNAVAFAEKGGREYVAVSGKDDRGRRGYVVLDFDTGALVYEHATFVSGAYAFEDDLHHEFEERLTQMKREYKEFYFGSHGIATLLHKNLIDQERLHRNESAFI